MSGSGFNNGVSGYEETRGEGTRDEEMPVISEDVAEWIPENPKRYLSVIQGNTCDDISHTFGGPSAISRGSKSSDEVSVGDWEKTDNWEEINHLTSKLNEDDGNTEEDTDISYSLAA